MKSLFLISIICLISTSLLAQDLFEEGYYLNNQGENVQGYIDVFPLTDSPTSIRFKKNRSDNLRSLSISEVSAFQVSGFKFVRFIGDIDLNLTPSSNTDAEFEDRQIFLRVIVEGEASLYSYKESDSEIYFYSTLTVPPTQLLNTEFIRADNSYAFNPIYKNQLRKLIECESNLGIIDDLKYDKKNLIYFFKEYNSCIDKPSKTFSGLSISSPKYLNISLSVGATSYSMVATTQLNNIRIVRFKDNAIPNIALELEQLLPVTKNKISIWLRGDFKSFTDSEVARFEGVNESSKLYYNTIETSLGARGYVGTDLVKAFLDVGMAKSFEIGKGVYIDYENRKDFDSPQFPLHFVFGAGLMIKNRFVLDTRLEYLDKRLSDQFSFEDINYSMLTVNFKYLLKSYYK